MSNEELALVIRQGEQGRTLELWEQVNGLAKRKALQIMTALQLSGNPRGVEFDDLYQTGYLAYGGGGGDLQPGARRFFHMVHVPSENCICGGYRLPHERRQV